MVDESDVRLRSNSFCLWGTDALASEVDRTRPFHSISEGEDASLERPVQGQSDGRWGETGDT